MLTGVLFDTVSNRATWHDIVRFIEDGEPVDVSGHRFILQVSRQSSPPPATGDIVLTATTDDGSIYIIPAPTLGVIEFTFSAAQMSALCPGAYDLGLTMQWAGEEESMGIGTAQIIDGVTRLR